MSLDAGFSGATQLRAVPNFSRVSEGLPFLMPTHPRVSAHLGRYGNSR